MKKISLNIINFYNKFPKTFTGTILSIFLGIATYFDVISNIYLKIFGVTNSKNNTVSLFSPSTSRDTVNILITNFDNYYNQKEPNPVGKVLFYRIQNLITTKKLPINAIYADTIISPPNQKMGKELLIKHNGDLLIYGVFKNETKDYINDGNIVFRTLSNNLINESNIDTKSKVEKNENNWRPFNSYNVENNIFKIDSLSFDNWIQSICILKSGNKHSNNNSNYSNYWNLYTKSKPKYIPEIIDFYIHRANLNRAIGNFYDSKTETDSAIFYVKKYSDSVSSSSFGKVKDMNDFFKTIQFGEKANSFISKLKENQYSDLVNFYEPEKAISEINKELHLKDSTLNRNAFLIKIKEEEAKTLQQNKTENTQKKTFSTKQVEQDFFGDNGIQLASTMNSTSIWEIDKLYILKSFILLSNFNDKSKLEMADSTFRNVSDESQNLLEYYFTGILLYKLQGNDGKAIRLAEKADSLKIIPKDTLNKYVNRLIEINNIKKNKTSTFPLNYILLPLIGIFLFVLLFLYAKKYFSKNTK